MSVHPALSTLLCATLVAVIQSCVPATTSTAPAAGKTPQTAARAQQIAKVEKVWATPAKVHRDEFLTSSFLKLKVTNFDAAIGAKVKASSLRTKAAEADDANDESPAEDEDVWESTATCQSAWGDGAPHDIAVVSDGFPAMSSHDDVMSITDKTANNTRIYASDQEMQRFTITGDGESLTVVLNPDGTLSVNGQSAPTFGDAARLIAATKLVKATTVESLAVLWGLVAGWEEIAEGTLTPCAPPTTTQWGGSGERVSIQAVGPDGDTTLTGLVRMVILLLTRPA